MSTIGEYQCALFALCRNPAAGVVATGLFVLGSDGYVPACQRCADRLGYELLDAVVDGV